MTDETYRAECRSSRHLTAARREMRLARPVTGAAACLIEIRSGTGEQASLAQVLAELSPEETGGKGDSGWPAVFVLSASETTRLPLEWHPEGDMVYGYSIGKPSATCGAPLRNRTVDLLLTMETLCRLS